MNKSTTLIREEKNTWKDYLSSREVETLIGVGKDTLNRYCTDGKITYSRPNNGKRRFLRQDVIKFINRNTYLSIDDTIERASTKGA